MKLLTWAVLLGSVTVMGFSVFMVTYAEETKDIEKMEKSDRPPCFSVFPAYIHFLGILGIVVALMGVPAYFGNKIQDEGTILVVQSILSLWLIVVALHVSTLANFEDKEVLMKKKHELMVELAKVRNVTLNATADRAAQLEAFNQLLEVRNIEILNYCCGAHGPKGYTEAGFAIPKSCCIVKNCNVSDDTLLYSNGCYEYLKTYVFNKNTKDAKDAVFPTKVMTRNLAIQMIFILLYYAIIFFSRIWPDTADTTGQ